MEVSSHMGGRLLSFQCWVGVSLLIISGPAQTKIGEERDAKPFALGPSLYLTFIKYLQHTRVLDQYKCPHFIDEIIEAQKG